MIKKCLNLLFKLFFLLCIFLSIGIAYVLIWNKHHNSALMSYKQVKSILTPIVSSPIDQKNNQKVVYVNGYATTNDQLLDDVIGLSVNALSYSRKVFMYQWEEQVKKVGADRAIANYHYQTTWSENLIASDDFYFKNGHENPKTKPLDSKKYYATEVNLGDFILSNVLIKKIQPNQEMALTNISFDKLEKKLGQKLFAVNSGHMLCTGDINKPHVGDICIEVNVAYPQEISVIAQQFDGKLQPYMSPAGEEIFVIDFGQKKPDVMIDAVIDDYDFHSPLKPLKILLRNITGF